MHIISAQNAQAPSGQGLAQSQGTNPSGTLTLGNSAQASFDPNSGFVATSNTQNSATGPNASITSVAQAIVITGNGPVPSDANVVGNGNAFSNGIAATGSLQNLDQSASSYANQITGQSQSQIQGSGTNLQQSSTANATVIALPGSQSMGKVVVLSVPVKKAVSSRDTVLPYAQGAASSAGTNPDGTVSLSNIAQGNYRYDLRQIINFQKIFIIPNPIFGDDRKMS